MRQRVTWWLLAVALTLGCEAARSQADAAGSDAATDQQRDDATDVLPDTAPPDALADVRPDVPPDGGPDARPDLPPDALPDGAPDADVPEADAPTDVTVPPGCCLTDADCALFASPVAHVCAVPGWGGAAITGVCKPVAPEGRCWRDADCPEPQVCHGAAVCPCNVDCDMDYEGPGVCVAPNTSCAAIDPSWVQEWCDAASLVLWDGQQCIGSCPGCCECKPFCDLVFHSMAECQAACAKKPCDPSPELAPFQLWAVFPNDDGGMGGGDTDTVADDAEVLTIGEPVPTVGTGGTQITFRLPDASLFKLLVQLPAGIAPPLVVGDLVHLYAKRSWPWWVDLVVVVWPTYGGWPLFYAQAAAQASPWYDCGDTTFCPTSTFLPSTCEPFDMTCGKGVLPPVQVLAAGQITEATEAEVGAVLQQGEMTDGYPGYTYGVVTAYTLTDYQCADYPTTWNASFLVHTYNAYKLAFDRDNASLFEFYELCVKNDTPGVEGSLQVIDPSLYCGVAGAFAGCDPLTEIGCHGDLAFVGDSKTLTPAKWAQLKALSLLDAVTRIGGGYWL